MVLASCETQDPQQQPTWQDSLKGQQCHRYIGGNQQRVIGFKVCSAWGT